MTRPAQHPASNSEARKRHDAPTCLVCGNAVPVDASALAAAKAEGRAEAWEQGWSAAQRSPWTAPGYGENPYRLDNTDGAA